jgi:hypothetical protein
MMRWAGHAAYEGEAGNFYELSSQFEDQEVRYKKAGRGHAMLLEDGSTHSYPRH